MFLKVCCVTALILSTIACNPGTKKAEVGNADSIQKTDSPSVIFEPRAAVPATGLEIEPAIRKTDSLQILYFDNPDGDSLRYTRFYKYVTSGDTVVNDLFLSNLDKPFSKVPAVKDCRSEGKIYMYAGENPVKTLYFSTRGDSCSYIYMISNGAFLYFKLNDNVRSQLKSMKKLAREP